MKSPGTSYLPKLGSELVSDNLESTRGNFPERDLWLGTAFECAATQPEAAIAVAISITRKH